ncbi:MAG: hypothetical protein WBC91_11105 [Phototrophicaceae bacterium]
MPYIYRIYHTELRQLEDAFSQVKRYGIVIEIDIDEVEETLEDWQELIAELYTEGDSESRKMAQEIETNFEHFEALLESYVAARITYEEQDAIAQAGNRLTQSHIENYHHNLKLASENPDTMRYYHVSTKLQVPEERPQPKQRSRLEMPPRNRLALDDE